MHSRRDLQYAGPATKGAVTTPDLKDSCSRGSPSLGAMTLERGRCELAGRSLVSYMDLFFLLSAGAPLAWPRKIKQGPLGPLGLWGTGQVAGAGQWEGDQHLKCE